MSNFYFPKSERLKSKQKIGLLFRQGQSFGKYPVRVVWMATTQADALSQVAFSVPKRRYKRAVQRNRLRRQMREAFRLHKNTLHQQLGAQGICIMSLFIYTGKEPMPYSKIERSMSHILQQLQKEMEDQF